MKITAWHSGDPGVVLKRETAHYLLFTIW